MNRKWVSWEGKIFLVLRLARVGCLALRALLQLSGMAFDAMC